MGLDYVFDLSGDTGACLVCIMPVDKVTRDFLQILKAKAMPA